MCAADGSTRSLDLQIAPDGLIAHANTCFFSQIVGQPLTVQSEKGCPILRGDDAPRRPASPDTLRYGGWRTRSGASSAFDPFCYVAFQPPLHTLLIQAHNLGDVRRHQLLLSGQQHNLNPLADTNIFRVRYNSSKTCICSAVWVGVGSVSL